jgi:aminocarboxymuconate-semialdehyde decarboxylase
MSEIMSCAPGPGVSHAAGPLRLGRRGATKIIDIHAHLGVPAADAVMRPHLTQVPAMGFSSPDSDSVNRELFARIGRKLGSLEERLADMDATGIDIQALSPLPGQAIYAVPPDIAREAARITNDGIAAAIARHPDRFVGMGVVPLLRSDRYSRPPNRWVCCSFCTRSASPTVSGCAITISTTCSATQSTQPSQSPI